MNRKLHGRRSGVIIDSCRDHGIWLDAGELRQLMEWTRAGGNKLCEKDYAREAKIKSDQEKRKQISKNHEHKISYGENKFVPKDHEQSPSDLLGVIIETVKDLFAY